MKLLAYAKINWALDITGRRADGYHLLDMVMQAIELHDELEFEPAGALSLTVNGIPCDDGRNLVLRAARALGDRVGKAPGAAIALTKRIPERAGLGGGSANCAATLRALNALWGLGLPEEALRGIGLGLGADVPFCLTGGLARVGGIGERIQPVANAPEIPLVLVCPGEGYPGLSTAPVFARWDRGGWPEVHLDGARLADAVARRDLALADRLSVNALTAPAVDLLPEIGRAMDDLRGLGAEAVFMTGSGSTAVGAFGDADAAASAARRLPGAILTRTLSENAGFSQFSP